MHVYVLCRYACLIYIVFFCLYTYPVLNELFNLRHILTAEECSKVTKLTYDDKMRDRLVLVLSVKPEGAVKEATKVMNVYHFNTQQLHGEFLNGMYLIG